MIQHVFQCLMQFFSVHDIVHRICLKKPIAFFFYKKSFILCLIAGIIYRESRNLTFRFTKSHLKDSSIPNRYIPHKKATNRTMHAIMSMYLVKANASKARNRKPGCDG